MTGWVGSMAGWDDGYVTDVTYTRNFFRETTPAWLSAASLFMGHRPPDLSRPFRYADLGCGHGLTAIVVAATCPQSEVWGFDFNPAHIESARDLADRAGLTNVRFEETSFADLAAMPAAALPSFDFMVSHGVLSWVSRENQAHLVDVIGQRLRPGGLAYLSYNVATGWAAMPPLHRLMRLLMRTAADRTDHAAAGVLDYLERMQRADAAYFVANPSVRQRLEEARKQDPRYLAHEFLNESWEPLMFPDVAAWMSGAKCSFIGSATLTENIDVVSVPQSMQELVRHTADPVLRETVRDFAGAKGFRRDIYRRGVPAMAGPEQAALIDHLELEWLGRPVEDPIKLPTPMGIVGGMPEIYTPLVAMLRAGACTIGAIHRHPAWIGRSVPDLLQAVTLLMSGGYVHPTMPRSVQTEARVGTGRLNAVLWDLAADGGDLGQIVSPVIGSALKADVAEAVLATACAAGHPSAIDVLTERLENRFGQLGLPVMQAGAAVTDPLQARLVLRETVRLFTELRLPALIRLGVFNV